MRAETIRKWTRGLFFPCLLVQIALLAAAADILFNLRLDRPALDNLRYLLPPAGMAAMVLAAAFVLACVPIAWFYRADEERRRRLYLGVGTTLFFLYLALQGNEVRPALRNDLSRLLTFACLGAGGALQAQWHYRLRSTPQSSSPWLLLAVVLYAAGAANLASWFYLHRVEEDLGNLWTTRLETLTHISGLIAFTAVFATAVLRLFNRLKPREMLLRLSLAFFVSFPAVCLMLALFLWAETHQGRFHLEFDPRFGFLALGPVALVSFVLALRAPWQFSLPLSTGATCLGLAVWGLLAFKNETPGARSVPGEIQSVILITPDTLRSDVLGAYGGAGVATPSLDALAADSILFEDASSTAPWTMPSFASLFTGLPSRVFGHFQYDSRIPSNAVMLAERLADEGYLTGATGSNPLLGYLHGYHQGFHHYDFYPREGPSRTLGSRLLACVFPGYFREETTTAALQEGAARWISRHRQTPFFFWLHFADPHSPYDPPPAYKPDLPHPANLPGDMVGAYLDLRRRDEREYNEEQQEWLWRHYLGEVRYVDECVGRLIEKLKHLELYDSSLIIFTSDHGEEFWEHGGLGHGRTLYEESLRVPWMIKLPGQSRTGRVSQPVSGLSLTPTLLDLLGIEFEVERMAAPSLRPLLFDETAPVPTLPLVASDPQRVDRIHSWSIRYNGHKLIQGIEDEIELYDLEQDAAESEDLSRRRPQSVARGLALFEKRKVRTQALREAEGIRKFDQVTLSPREVEQLEGLGYL